MADGWDAAVGAAQGKWLRLGAEPIDLVFTGDPMVRRVHGFGRQQMQCALAGCSQCAAGDDAATKITFMVYQVNADTHHLFELSRRAMGALGALGREQVRNNVIRMTRSGQGYNTAYTASVVGPVTDGIRRRVNAGTDISFADLEAIPTAVMVPQAQPQPNPATTTAQADDDGIPF